MSHFVPEGLKTQLNQRTWPVHHIACCSMIFKQFEALGLLPKWPHNTHTRTYTCTRPCPDTPLMHANVVPQREISRRASRMAWACRLSRKGSRDPCLTSFFFSRLTSVVKPVSVTRLLSNARRQADPVAAQGSMPDDAKERLRKSL